MATTVSGAAIDCNNTKLNVCYGYSQGAPGKLYDWRISDVRDYFTNQVIAPYMDNSNISGIFFDDTTDVAQRCMFVHQGVSIALGNLLLQVNTQPLFAALVPAMCDRTTCCNAVCIFCMFSALKCAEMCRDVLCWSWLKYGVQ
jgi:hypothetical protein